MFSLTWYTALVGEIYIKITRNVNDIGIHTRFFLARNKLHFIIISYFAADADVSNICCYFILFFTLDQHTYMILFTEY